MTETRGATTWRRNTGNGACLKALCTDVIHKIGPPTKLILHVSDIFGSNPSKPLTADMSTDELRNSSDAFDCAPVSSRGHTEIHSREHLGFRDRGVRIRID